MVWPLHKGFCFKDIWMKHLNTGRTYMKSRFLASLGSPGPAFLCGPLCWRFRNGLRAPPLQGSTRTLLSSLTSGERYSASLMQPTYFMQERKGLAPNLVGSGRNLGEGSCLLTLSWLWYFIFLFNFYLFSHPYVFYSFKIFIVYVQRVNAGSVKRIW